MGEYAPDVSLKRVALVSKSLVSEIFACVGFGADFTLVSLLATYSPDWLHFPTTNGEHCTSGAIEMVGPGARHRLGEARRRRGKIRVFSVEALRELVGSFVSDVQGNRVFNVSGRRDNVIGEMCPAG